MIMMIGGMICFAPACGKRRPPLPPTARPAGLVNNLTARQEGNRIVLKITLPASAKSFKQIDVYRLNQPQTAPDFLSEEDFSSRSTLIGVIPSLSASQTSSVSYNDVLSDLTSAGKLRYAVRLISSDGRRSSLSNFLIVAPSFQIPLPPILSDVRVEPSAIRLAWQKPVANLDGTKPANVSGYNVYRALAAEKKTLPADAVLLNPAPITETTFGDLKFDFGVKYQYFVRAVTSGGTNPPIESLDSNFQLVTPLDTFPPLPPQGLTIAAAPRRLSLFFAANSEADVAGYLIYRSLDERLPLDEWRQLTPTPLSTTTFQDETVESGQKYFYYLKAIDQAGNLSEPSQVVSEIVP